MTLNITDLAPHLGSLFIAHTHSGLVALCLAQAAEHPRHAAHGNLQAPISLIFTGPLDTLLAQDVYYLDHAFLGRQQWMVVPVSKCAADPVAAAQALLAAVPNPTQNAQYEVVLG